MCVRLWVLPAQVDHSRLEAEVADLRLQLEQVQLAKQRTEQAKQVS
jgi:hypothetical protein